MVRCHTLALRALAAGAALMLLAGCSQDPAIGSDRTDLAAAVDVWSDPWVAPTSATVAGPALGSNGQVSRTVARRETSYDASVEDVVATELDAAESAGWAPTSSSCGESVQIALAGPGGALAQLVASAEGTVVVEVATRHHLDTAWEIPADVPDGATCLAGDTPDFEEPPLQSAPLGGDDGDDDAAEWSDATADPALLDEVNADPALAALGLRVVEPTLDDGINRRQAPAAAASIGTSTLSGLRDQLPGWELTFAACGGRGLTRSTFVRAFEGGPAVLTAHTGPDGTTMRVTLPVVEGPEPSWIEDLVPLDASPCLGGTPRRLLVDGNPAVLPSDLTPIAD